MYNKKTLTFIFHHYWGAFVLGGLLSWFFCHRPEIKILKWNHLAQAINSMFRMVSHLGSTSMVSHLYITSMVSHFCNTSMVSNIIFPQ